MRMIPKSRIVFFTHKSSNGLLITVTNFTKSFFFYSFTSKTISNLLNTFYFRFGKIPGRKWLMTQNMSRLGKQFKIFYSIISFNTVYMMYYFPGKWFQFSSNVLLHNIHVLLHPFTIDINTQVSIPSKSGLIPQFSFKTTKSLPSSLMHGATDYRFSTNSRKTTILNRTKSIDFSTLHIYSLLQTGRYCQW